MSLTPKPKSSPLLKILSTAALAGSVAAIGCEDVADAGDDEAFSADASTQGPDGGVIPPMPPPQGDAGVVPPMPPPQVDAGFVPPMPPPQVDAGFIPPMPPPQVDGGFVPPMPPPMPGPTPGDS